LKSHCMARVPGREGLTQRVGPHAGVRGRDRPRPRRGELDGREGDPRASSSTTARCGARRARRTQGPAAARRSP
jgi:hypothetical protein